MEEEEEEEEEEELLPLLYLRSKRASKWQYGDSRLGRRDTIR